MSQKVDTKARSFQVSAALLPNRRVKLNATGKLAYAGAADTDALGVTLKETFAADDWVAVDLFGGPGTYIAEASEAIALTDTLYAAASGRVASSGTVLHGKPLETASAAGSFIETQLSPAAVIGNTARSALTQDDLQPYVFPLTSLRKWDDAAVTLPAAAATDDLGLVTGTFLTDALQVRGRDSKSASLTGKAAFVFALPPEYVAGQTVTVRLNCNMETTVSDTTATVDLQVVDHEGDPTADICATAPQSINSLTAADKDFTITPAGLVAGDELYCVITIAVVDGAGVGVVIGALNRVEILADIKG